MPDENHGMDQDQRKKQQNKNQQQGEMNRASGNNRVATATRGRTGNSGQRHRVKTTRSAVSLEQVVQKANQSPMFRTSTQPISMTTKRTLGQSRSQGTRTLKSAQRGSFIPPGARSSDRYARRGAQAASCEQCRARKARNATRNKISRPPLLQDHPHDVGAARAQRHAHTDLTEALGVDPAQITKNADHRENARGIQRRLSRKCSKEVIGRSSAPRTRQSRRDRCLTP